jgi:hypothetical protein
MLHSEFAARLETSGVERRLQVFQLRKGVELQHVQVWTTCDSLLRKERRSDDHVAHDATPNIHFRSISHMFHAVVWLLWSPYPSFRHISSTRDMKSGLVGKHYICQKVGVSVDSVKHVTGKTVSPWVVLWFQLLQNLQLVRRGTQPLSENLMQCCSCDLQFSWGLTDWLHSTMSTI